MFFHLENAKGHFRFYKELLSSSMGVEAGCMISDDTFVKACHIALKGYLHNELEADADDEAAGHILRSERFGKPLRLRPSL